MKSNYLFTGMLAVTTLVVASCGAPRLAQQNSNDDVYNSVAQAREYKQQVPVRDSDYDAQDEEYYGTSDPYYDMDYSSRINRFYGSGPSWMGYYDPYYDGGWYGNYGMSLGFGFGFGFNPFYGSLWRSPYYNSWGNYYSPFWGYNNYYGGGYYGGGLWGGGYWGGGFYTGRTTPVDYRARPSRGASDVYTGNRGGYLNGGISPRSSRGNTNGTVGYSRPSRGNAAGTTRTSNTDGSRPSRTESSRPTRQSQPESRPTRTETRPTRESYTPPPSYNPPSRSSGSEGRSGGSYGGGSSGGTTRPSRGGGR
uniref:hypothetical protein n=1 Tax=Pedobacter schmidteae TaxID=2201271 RepID=UPI0013CE7140|nr:hypothetical protein [Pedobacter schmidteae]